MKLKDILYEQNGQVKSLLERGLDRVARRSHLVTRQIRNNKDEFLRNLDVDKFISEFGKLKGILGVGVFGAVFDLPGKKVLKFTFDYHEAPFLYRLSKNPREEMVDVDKVRSFDFGSSETYGIVRDGLTPIDETSYYSDARSVISDLKMGRRKKYKDEKKEEIKDVLMSMYEMDPNWDGTHVGNLGIQNEDIVLYDGFSKNVELSASTVPEVNLKKNET